MTALLLAVGATLGVGSVRARPSASASEATKVRAVLTSEIAMFNSKRWQPAWRMYTPQIRSHCSYRRFARAMGSIRNTTGPVTVRNVTVRVTGGRGLIVYRIFANGRLVGGSTAKQPDVYRRINGRWFDDFDANGLCPSGDRPS